MAAKERARKKRSSDLETAIHNVTVALQKATRLQIDTHWPKLEHLLLQVRREPSATISLDDGSEKANRPAGSSKQSSSLQPKVQALLDGLRGMQDVIHDFFRNGKQLSNLVIVDRTEDQRVQDFLLSDNSLCSKMRKLLAVLSLFNVYDAWKQVQESAGYSGHDIGVPLFLRQSQGFRNADAAEQAIRQGKRFQQLERKFPGTSAIVAFVYTTFIRAGPIQQLMTEFDSDEFKFITDLGQEYSSHLEDALRQYNQTLGFGPASINAAPQFSMDGVRGPVDTGQDMLSSFLNDTIPMQMQQQDGLYQRTMHNGYGKRSPSTIAQTLMLCRTSARS